MEENPARSWREREDDILSRAGFEEVEGDVWSKGGVLYGRGAALQLALRRLRESGEDTSFDRT